MLIKIYNIYVRHIKSKQLFKEASKVLVGGVNSPVRAFKAVGGDPVFIKKGSGAYVQCEDGHHYIDYILSYGPLILGHAYPEVIRIVEETARLGMTFGSPSALETKAAIMIQKAYSYVDKVRFVNSGTEASMSAVRLARGYTNKSIIVKFKGCYHGHVDPLLVSAGSGIATLGKADSKGVLEKTASMTAVLDYNDKKAVKQFFDIHHKDIACIILEPVTGNMGVIKPDLDFIKTCRECCNNSGALLIFDEVMCGFRAQRTGTHEWIGVTPDIVILGKVIGGGLPCGAYAANDRIMSCVSPLGDVYQAGTLSGNPMAMAAGLKTLELLESGNIFDSCNEYTSELVEELKKEIKKHNLNISVHVVGTMFTIFFSNKKITNFADVSGCDLNLFKSFFHYMLRNGVLLPPSQFEACFTSYLHTSKELGKTLDAFKGFIKNV